MVTARKHLIKYIDPDKNPAIDPYTVPLRDNRHAHFRCPDCGYSWIQQIRSFYTRQSQYTCARCADRKLYVRGRMDKFLDRYPEAIRWLDKSKYTEEGMHAISLSEREPLYYKCIYCEELFVGGVGVYARRRNKHLSGKCVAQPLAEINEIISKFGSNLRFKVLSIQWERDWDKFCRDLESVALLKDYKYFLHVYAERFKYDKVARLNHVTRQCVSLHIRRIDRVIEELLRINKYAMYKFGVDPTKIAEEARFLRGAYMFMSRSIL